MSYKADFEKCRVIIRDSVGGDTIADTAIIEHNKKEDKISIDLMCFDHQKYQQVSLLIFVENSLYEYSGSVRKSANVGMLDIALYEGREKEDRAYKRYVLDTEGTVESILVLGHKAVLHKPVSVKVENISASGILFKTFPNTFYIGSQVQLVLIMNKNKVMFDCEIVRTHDLSLDITEYGCKFLTARVL